MKKRRSTEGMQINSLQKLGILDDLPSTDYSDQPDSGSRIGGVRGRQEYGIEGGESALQESSENIGSTLLGDLNIDDELERKRSAHDEGDNEALKEHEDTLEELQDEDDQTEVIETSQELKQIAEARLRAPSIADQSRELQHIIEDRLHRNPSLCLDSLVVTVLSAGLVTVSGRVQSEAAKLRVTEIIGSLPGVVGIRNILEISRECRA